MIRVSPRGALAASKLQYFSKTEGGRLTRRCESSTSLDGSAEKDQAGTEKRLISSIYHIYYHKLAFS